jgi:hypothetical protein
VFQQNRPQTDRSMGGFVVAGSIGNSRLIIFRISDWRNSKPLHQNGFKDIAYGF